MSRSMTAKASHAMTVDTRLLAMIATTVSIASGTTVRSVQLIAKCAIPRSAWAVLMNAPPAMNLFAKIVQQHAKNAKKHSARTA